MTMNIGLLKMTKFTSFNGIEVERDTWIAESCGIRGVDSQEGWQKKCRTNPGIIIGVNTQATYKGYKRELVAVNSKNGPIQLLLDYK